MAIFCLQIGTTSVEEISGVVSAQANINVVPNELIVHFRTNSIALRDIISEIHEMGYKSAVYAPAKEKDDIRDIL